MKAETGGNGKMLWSLYFQSKTNPNHEYGKWEIKELEVNKGNENLEDSYEATSHAFRSMGFDGTLVGPTPGKNGMGAGSGSNSREGANVLFTSLRPMMEIALEPLEVVRDVNGWSDALRFWLDVPYMPSKNEISTKDRTPSNE
jgi:hypothetical protein